MSCAPDTFCLNELTNAAQPYAGELTPSPKTAALDLLDYLHKTGSIETPYPWALDVRDNRRLEAHFGYAPAGGWARFCNVFTGTGATRMDMFGFHAVDELGSWQEVSDKDFRVSFTESLTRYFIPPNVAAGLFVLLGIQPLWGLQLVKLQGRAGNVFDANLCPAENINAVKVATFGMLSATFEAIAALGHHNSYPNHALASLMLDAARFARSKAERLATRKGSIPVFNDDVRPKMADMFASDLVKNLLVPAGMAKELPNDRVVFHPSMKEVDVGHLTRGERHLWFQGLVGNNEVRSILH